MRLNTFLLLSLLLYVRVDAQDCEIVFGGSLTLEEPVDDGLSRASSVVSKQTQMGFDLFMSHVVHGQGPFQVGDRLCTVRMEIVSEDGTRGDVRRAYEELVASDSQVDFLLGPTTSTLSIVAKNVSEASEKILIGTTASADAFIDNSVFTFNTLPKASKAFDLTLTVLALDGAKTISMLVQTEDAISSSGCSRVDRIASSLRMDVVGHAELIGGEVAEVVAARAVDDLIDQGSLGADVLVVCALNTFSHAVVAELKARNILPNAVALFPFTGVWLASPLRPYMLESALWSSGAAFAPDDYYGTNADFVSLFEEMHGVTPDNGGMTGALAPMILLEAIRNADSLDTEAVRFALTRTNMDTFAYGETTYGVDNALTANMVVKQYDIDGVGSVVAPLLAAQKLTVYPIPTWDQRSQDLGWLKFTSEIAFLVLTILCMLTSIAWMILIGLCHKHDPIRYGTPTFLVLMLVGSLAIYASVFTWMIYVTDASCAALPWLLALGFTFMFGAILVKNYRVYRVWKAGCALQRFSFSQRKLALYWILQLVPVIVLLIVWTSVDPLVQLIHTPDPLRPSEDYTTCHASDTATGFGAALVGYCGMGLVLNMVISIKTWKIDRTVLREGMSIAAASYTAFLAALVGFCIVVSGSVDYEAEFIIRAACILVMGFSTCSFVMAPKLAYLIKGMTIRHESLQMTTETTTRTSSPTTIIDSTLIG
jgi:branched-chain amino acid transport system substrate-binding protein